MAYDYTLKRRVEFCETDMAGIVHFSNFFRYMEAAEHAFIRSLGASVVLDQYDPPLGLPRVHVSCDYLRPLRFEEEFQVHLQVTAKRSKSLSYRFSFSKPEDPQREILATGKMTVVCVAHLPEGKLKAVALPGEISDRVEVAPDQTRSASQILDHEQSL